MLVYSVEVLITQMYANKKGQAVGGGVVGAIVGLTVAAILMVNVFFPQIIGTNTSDWDSASVTLWNTLQVAGAIGMLILTFRALGIL